jgi:excisionase family DNA binding protein
MTARSFCPIISSVVARNRAIEVMHMEKENLAYTCPEVAKAARISVPMVRKLLRNGRLKAVRIGRCVRIGADELKRLLAEGVR